MTPFIWDFDPVFFELGPLTVQWYGVLFSLAFLVGYTIMSRIYRLENKPQEDLGDLLVYMMVATIVGARLGHCLFYAPGYYLSNLLEILKVWEGGLASHGGAIGIALGMWMYSRRHPSQPFLWLLDRLVIPTALAGSFIRLGNFFNSEIIGEPSDAPWAIVFAGIDRIPRHPAQLYESVAYLIIFGLLAAVYRRLEPDIPRGRILGLFLVLVFSARMLIEVIKTQQAAYSLPFAMSVGQLLSIPAIMIGVWFIWQSNSFTPEQFNS